MDVSPASLPFQHWSFWCPIWCLLELKAEQSLSSHITRGNLFKKAKTLNLFQKEKLPIWRFHFSFFFLFVDIAKLKVRIQYALLPFPEALGRFYGGFDLADESLLGTQNKSVRDPGNTKIYEIRCLLFFTFNFVSSSILPAMKCWEFPMDPEFAE